MSIIDDDVAEVRAKMEGVLGLKAWNVSLGIGSYVTMDFGEPVEVRISSKLTITRGQWHLWVQYSPWRIEARNKVIAGSDDPREKLERAVKYFEGLALQSIVLTPPAPDVAFVFEDDVVLKLFPFNFTGEFEDWYLYTPDGHVLVLGGRQPWAYVKSGKSSPERSDA
jgi:hypothetical protein